LVLAARASRFWLGTLVILILLVAERLALANNQSFTWVLKQYRKSHSRRSLRVSF
jgi:hypothetical protein